MASLAGDDLLDGVMEVMASGFDPEFNESWTRRQVADSLALPTGHILAIDRTSRLTDGGDIAGFALSRAAPGEEELLLVAVDPAWRARGLGRKLLQELAGAALNRGATRLFLEMREGNPARHLYEAIGFSQIGRRRDYYRTRSGQRLDAITYGLELNR